MRNRMYGGVRGRKTKVGEKLLRFPPTRFWVAPCSLKGQAPKQALFAILAWCHAIFILEAFVEIGGI